MARTHGPPHCEIVLRCQVVNASDVMGDGDPIQVSESQSLRPPLHE